MGHSQKSSLNVTFLKKKRRTDIKFPYKIDNRDYELLGMYDGAICSVIDLTSAKTPDLMVWLEKKLGRNHNQDLENRRKIIKSNGITCSIQVIANLERKAMQKITPHLWFDKEAREAAEFYTSLFPDSKVTNITTLHNTPSGDSDIVYFELAGQSFMAISAGPSVQVQPPCHSL
jgi:hypothetical protein